MTTLVENILYVLQKKVSHTGLELQEGFGNLGKLSL